MPEGFKFGQKIADDYVPAESDGAQWIRGFRDASTQIRIAPAEGINAQGQRVTGYKAWPTERVHYDEDLQVAYACMKEYGMNDPEGMGCNSTSKKVRERSRKYYVNALDKEGELRIFQFGPSVYNVLKMRQDRMMAEKPENDQPLSDRDYIINKSGSGMKTSYDVETGDKYEVEFPAELHDISAALEAAFKEAVAKFNGDEPIGNVKDEDEDRAVRKAPQADDDEPPARPAAKKTAAKKAAPAAAKKAAAPEPADVGDTTEDDLQDMELDDLREWVGARVPADFDLPARAPRSRLIKIGTALINGEEPVPF